MTLIDDDFKPENIQQLKELAKHVRHPHGATPASVLHGYKEALEKNIADLSARIDNLQKSRDEFIAQFDKEINGQQIQLQEVSETFSALLEYAARHLSDKQNR